MFDVKSAYDMLEAVEEARGYRNGRPLRAAIPNRFDARKVISRKFMRALSSGGEIVLAPVADRVTNTECVLKGLTARAIILGALKKDGSQIDDDELADLWRRPRGRG